MSHSRHNLHLSIRRQSKINKYMYSPLCACLFSFTNARSTAYNPTTLLAQNFKIQSEKCLIPRGARSTCRQLPGLPKLEPKPHHPSRSFPRKRRPEALTTREQEILEFDLDWLQEQGNRPTAQNQRENQQVQVPFNMMKKIRVSNTAQLLKAAIQGKMLKVR